MLEQSLGISAGVGGGGVSSDMSVHREAKGQVYPVAATQGAPSVNRLKKFFFFPKTFFSALYNIKAQAWCLLDKQNLEAG